ncbi:MFS transporter, SP family, solute carrier family 2 [Acrasis kona]|uniref:MFS transporter, SP family, solute carrier family 2 n=1 Tax=Acrasis kona TaxID=1008807 RepID=A0AAW2ZHB1_9EUKA
MTIEDAKQVTQETMYPIPLDLDEEEVTPASSLSVPTSERLSINDTNSSPEPAVVQEGLDDARCSDDLSNEKSTEPGQPDQDPKDPLPEESSSVEKEPALPNQGWNITVVFVCLIFCLSALQNGYLSSVINSPRSAVQCGDWTDADGNPITEHPVAVPASYPGFMKECIPMNDVEWAVMVALFTIGGLIGGLSGGFFADLIGRRQFLWINNIFFMIAYFLMSCFSEFYVIIFGRLFAGIASGITTIVVPMYFAEMCPVRLIGSVGVFPQLAATVGILVSACMSIGLSTRPVGWRVLFGWLFIAPIIQMCLLPFCPESPKWYLFKRKNEDMAERSLQRLRRSNDVKEELLQLKEKEGVAAKDVDANAIQTTRLQRFRAMFRKNLIRPFIVAIGLQMIQQLCGVNVVFSYSTSFFVSAGLGNVATICSAIVALINVIATIAVVPVIDRVGRKTILIIGESICLFFFVLLVFCFIFLDYSPKPLGIVSVIGVIGFVIGFAASLGPIPWIVAAEMFPADVKPMLMGICIAVNWLFSPPYNQV